MLAGVSAIVAGHLKRLPELDPLQAHPRNGNNFADDPSWLFQCSTSTAWRRSTRSAIDRPEDFGAVVLREVRRRLPAAFEMRRLRPVRDQLDRPAVQRERRARQRPRAVPRGFLLSRPLFFAEQRQIVIALKERPGLDCLDLAIYSCRSSAFVARPEFPDDMTDPIEEPVLLHKGDQRHVDVDMLLTEIDVELASPKGRSGTRGTPVRAEERRLDVAPELRVPLVRQAVEAIVNDLNRVDWVRFAHAVDGAVDGDPAGRDIFLEFTARWEGEADPYEEDFDQVGDADPPEGGEEPDPEEERPSGCGTPAAKGGRASATCCSF